MTSVVNKKRVRISSPGSDSNDRVEENPESEKKGNTCYVCDGQDDWVLVCHGVECLISIHQSCTCVEPDFDEFGNFFCPYCWYKRLVLKSLKLREKLLVIDKSGVDLGVSDNVAEVNVSQGRRECDESYEKFMAMEKDQRRKEVAAETQSQAEKNHISEDGDEVDLAFNEQEDNCFGKDDQIEHPISTDNVQELALIIHHPIEAQPFRSVPPPKNGTALHDPKQRKRRRVFWTQAEEEMLKVGVQKFPGIRNIPWRKILEFGRDVFHQDRVPSDLKDKWKMINKISFEAPRRESGKHPLN